MNLFNMMSLGEVIRSSAFIITLYVLTYNYTDKYPIPFLWIFKDLSKFIYEPTCLETFMNYLELKEQKSSRRLPDLIILNKMIFLYLESFKDNETVPDDENVKQISAEKLRESLKKSRSILISGLENQNKKEKYLEYMRRLEPSFQRFKKTNAFKFLKEQIIKGEKISENIVNTS